MLDFDLAEIDTVAAAEAGVEVPIISPSGAPLLNKKGKPVSVTVLGTDSKLYRKLNRELGRKRLSRLQKARGRLITDEEIDLQDKEDIDLLSKVTTGWAGIIDSKGKPIEFSTEGVADLYRKYPVVREQAEAALNDRARFIQPSPQG